jgi:hypothetical protein
MASIPTSISKRSAPEEPHSPPLVETKCVTCNNPSSGKMTRVDCGSDRKSIHAYNGSMWCHACDMFENDKPPTPKLKQTGIYRCTSSHKEDGNPQTKEEGWLAKRQRRSQTPEDYIASQKKMGDPPHIKRIKDIEKEMKELTRYRIMYLAECQKKRKLQKDVMELKCMRESRRLTTTSENLTTADQDNVTA